jgi:chromosome segregation ATPase
MDGFDRSTTLQQRVIDLRQRAQKLRDENCFLKSQTESASYQSSSFRSQNKQLSQDFQKLKAERDALANRLEALQQIKCNSSIVEPPETRTMDNRKRANGNNERLPIWSPP